MASLVWTIAALLAVLWVLGFAINIGAWVHFLLALAVVAVIFNLIAQAAHVASPHHPETH